MASNKKTAEKQNKRKARLDYLDGKFMHFMSAHNDMSKRTSCSYKTPGA